MQRRDLHELSGETYDVLVIGAGINGCAAAQQLAAQGFKTLIIDKGDFAEGATSKSSRLLHCGLRHLAPGKSIWGMLSNPVYLATALINAQKAMDARSDIAKTLPELTQATNFCFPIYDKDPFAPPLVDMAFALLHMLGPKDLPLDYKRFGPKELHHAPFTKYLREPAKIRGMSTFSEYLFDWPERIAIDVILDAARMGAEVRNYTNFVSLHKKDDNSWNVTIEDSLIPSEKAVVNAKIVLNVSGAWSDQVADAIKPKLPQKVLKLKGAHIAVRLPEELSKWGMIAMNRVNEPFYCVPNRGLHFVGLNRIPYEKDATGIRADEDEVDWLLGEVNYMLPKINLTRKNVEFTMAGLQPITFDENDPHGSRAIKIHDLADEGLDNVLTLTGGPIMTHRRVGKDLAKAVHKRIQPTRPQQTLTPYATKITNELDASRGPNREIQVTEDTLKKIATTEQPQNLTDVMFRRTGLAWNDGQARDQVAHVTEIIAKPLGWDKNRTQQEIQSYFNHLDQDFSDHKK